MVASDTVIGVVGALLLAGVMVGVFVYEYNNAPDTPDMAEQSITNFKEEYPPLNATGDLDGDGTANHVDRDFDGDGLDNNNDTTIAVVTPFAGQMGTASSPSATVSQEFAFSVHEGMVGLHAVAFYNSTSPSPLPRSPAITMSVHNGAGEAQVSAQGTQVGTAVTLTIDSEEPLAPGEYIVRLTLTGPSPQATTFNGRVVVDYGAGHAAEGHAHPGA